MKMKKELNKLVMIIGFLIAMIGGIIAPLALETTLAAPFSVAQIGAILSVAFVFSKNGVVKNVGYALTAAAGAAGLQVFFWAPEEDIGAFVTAVGLLIMMAAGVIYLIAQCLSFFGFVKGDSEGATERSCVNGTIDMLGRYKELQQNHVLTEDEFNSLKQQLLENAGRKTHSIDDLKKWKKMLDQQVITEDEFSKIKEGIFAK